MLLSEHRVFSAPAGRRLLDLLSESRKYQAEVSNRLSDQVLGALWELLRGFQASDPEDGRRIFDQTAREEPEHIYGGQLTLLMRLVRAEMLEVLRTDYIKFARARGLSNRAVNFGHALKNTLVPVITITGLQIGSLIAFAIITETVFQWPGMGLLFLQAIQFVDIPVMAAYLCLVAFIFVVINLLVDLLYYAIDPRLRLEGTGHAH